jgi:hypothetical protein
VGNRDGVLNLVVIKTMDEDGVWFDKTRHDDLV